MKTCVFAGTFDPITIGHEYCINKCVEMFDKVIVAVGVNTDKKPLFSLNDRINMIKSAFNGKEKVIVKAFDGMLVDFMRNENASIYVRGIRDEVDYKYENTMAMYNNDMYPELTTIFLPTPKELVYISSSAIRNIMSLKSDASKYLSKPVLEYIKNIK